MSTAALLVWALCACDGEPVRSGARDAGVGTGGDGPALTVDAAPDAGAAGDSAPVGDGGVAADAPGDSAPATQWVEVCNVTTSLNLRAGPGTSHAVLTTMPSGARLKLLGKSGVWWNVDYNGQVGWAHSSYLCPAQQPGVDGGGGGGTGDGGPGASIGTMWVTYYYVAYESDYSGSKTATLYDRNCQPLASVTPAFSDAVCIEGSGKLSNGDVINVDGSCSCGRSCPTGGRVCYKKLGPAFPWGLGAYGNGLRPFRSVAVDKSVIPLRRTVYIKEWDGVAIPTVDGIGGFVHDGCFRADDVGGGIKGYHYDFFSGTRAMYRALDKIFATKSNFSVFDGGARCAYLKP